MTNRQVEAIEQALIKYFGRQGIDKGGTLLNTAAGFNVSSGNTAYGFRLLTQIGYPGF
jgi:hypothetical protein